MVLVVVVVKWTGKGKRGSSERPNPLVIAFSYGVVLKTQRRHQRRLRRLRGVCIAKERRRPRVRENWGNVELENVEGIRSKCKYGKGRLSTLLYEGEQHHAQRDYTEYQSTGWEYRKHSDRIYRGIWECTMHIMLFQARQQARMNFVVAYPLSYVFLSFPSFECDIPDPTHKVIKLLVAQWIRFLDCHIQQTSLNCTTVSL